MQYTPRAACFAVMMAASVREKELEREGRGVGGGGEREKAG